MLPPDDFNPPVGVAQKLEPGLRRIVAPNPSPMTYRGTNTYLLGGTGHRGDRPRPPPARRIWKRSWPPSPPVSRSAISW
jgi:hypothetical protein